MKCNDCKKIETCDRWEQYCQVIWLIIEITDSKEPEHGRACEAIAALYDKCADHEATP